MVPKGRRHALLPHGGHTGKHQVSREVGGLRGTCGEEPFLWFPWEGTGEAREAGLGLASRVIAGSGV